MSSKQAPEACGRELPGKWPFPANALSRLETALFSQARSMAKASCKSPGEEAQLVAFMGLNYRNTADATAKFVGADGKFGRRAYLESLGLPGQPESVLSGDVPKAGPTLAKAEKLKSGVRLHAAATPTHTPMKS